MAIYFDYQKRFNEELVCSPVEAGYYILPVYRFNFDDTGIVYEWIEENIQGEWTCWDFVGIPRGRSYCFVDQEDAFKFKLRWC